LIRETGRGTQAANGIRL